MTGTAGLRVPGALYPRGVTGAAGLRLPGALYPAA